jgi:hypothetical protein
MYDLDDYRSDLQKENDFYENEMHEYKKKATSAISQICEHFIEDFSSILIYSWHECLPSAQRIIDKMNLSKLDLLSLQDAFHEFKDEYRKENQITRNF